MTNLSGGKTSLKVREARMSPTEHAGDCQGETKKGKDGLMYVSRADKNNVYHWKKVDATTPKKSGKKSVKKSAKKSTKKSAKKSKKSRK
jgi:hypothetical protein